MVKVAEGGGEWSRCGFALESGGYGEERKEEGFIVTSLPFTRTRNARRQNCNFPYHTNTLFKAGKIDRRGRSYLYPNDACLLRITLALPVDISTTTLLSTSSFAQPLIEPPQNRTVLLTGKLDKLQVTINRRWAC